MSDRENLGGERDKGWAPNKPSARKSIHDHANCIFLDCNYTMGRYGLRKCNDETKGESSNQLNGYDTVDNAMSKLAPHKINSNKTRRKERRNSFNTPFKNSLEYDSDSNMLAKSLPADMPSYYSSGEEFVHQSLPTDFYNGHDHSLQSSTHTHSFESRNSEEDDVSFSEERNQPQHKKNIKKILLPFFGCITLLAAYFYNRILNVPLHSINMYDELKFNQDINDLGEKYKLSDHSILELQTGISTISERNDTGSFIFVYSSKSINFDQMQFNNFLEDIAVAAAKYLRNESKSTQPTIVQGSQLNMKTHSELMNRYRNEVAKTGVMLVKDIDKIPSSLAMAFHYFCDEYNPLVAKTAIFFTLNLDRCTTSELRSTHTDIEKCLANKWDSIPKDNMKPLLARVVNVIVDISKI